MNHGPSCVCDACIEATVGPCADCGAVEARADHAGRLLCYECWHAARGREVPYQVRQRGGYVTACRYLRAEAEAFAAELRYRNGGDYLVERAESWDGERLAHPGYLRVRVNTRSA